VTALQTEPKARAEARSAPEVAIEFVDADRARWWLAANENNRGLRVAHAEEYTRAMQRQEWELSPDAIAFDTEGRLINGQHRLVAVATSGVGQYFIVARGFPAVSQEATDTGAKRHLGDMLKLRGVPDAPSVAGVTGYVWKYLRYGSFMPPMIPPTVQEQIATWERHPEILTSSRFAKQMAKRGPFGPAWIGALHYLFSQVEPEDANTFVEKLANGTELSEGDAILVLRRQLERARARSSASYNPSVYTKAAWTIKAWNAWIDGAPVTSPYSWRAGGSSPEPFPQIAQLRRDEVDPILASMAEGPRPSRSAAATVADLLGGNE
jgi:hypothetical protein